MFLKTTCERSRGPYSHYTYQFNPEVVSKSASYLDDIPDLCPDHRAQNADLCFSLLFLRPHGERFICVLCVDRLFVSPTYSVVTLFKVIYLVVPKINESEEWCLLVIANTVCMYFCKKPT